MVVLGVVGVTRGFFPQGTWQVMLLRQAIADWLLLLDWARWR